MYACTQEVLPLYGWIAFAFGCACVAVRCCARCWPCVARAPLAVRCPRVVGRALPARCWPLCLLSPPLRPSSRQPPHNNPRRPPPHADDQQYPDHAAHIAIPIHIHNVHTHLEKKQHRRVHRAPHLFRRGVRRLVSFAPLDCLDCLDSLPLSLPLLPLCPRPAACCLHLPPGAAAIVRGSNPLRTNPAHANQQHKTQTHQPIANPSPSLSPTPPPNNQPPSHP